MGCTCSKTIQEPLTRVQSLPTLLSSNLKLSLKFSGIDGQATQNPLPGETLSLDESSIASVDWEAELSAVSLDLGEKLKDPHFVAKSCYA
eukprot:Skav203792  [mRNA]  locus=scaffold206:576402:577102:+ [translate_table: standard]